jgi:hypothetical protein
MDRRIIVLIAVWIAFQTGCATTRKQAMVVESTPEDALVTVCTDKLKVGSPLKKIAGATPLNKVFEFEKDHPMVLEFEKRGYAGKKVTVDPQRSKISVTLERLIDSDGSPAKTFVFPEIRRIIIAEPRFKSIFRGFSSETVSPEASKQAQQALTSGSERFLNTTYETVTLSPASDPKRFRSIWRDAKNLVNTIHPIRLKYQPSPLLLASKSSCSAVQTLGRLHNADVLLLLSGKQNTETAGMVAGKIGMTIGGTANSYAAGWSRAIASGDKFFAYNIYTPQFKSGAVIHAMLIECRTGEIIWANRGIWPPIPFDQPTVVDRIMKDLFFGLDNTGQSTSTQ